MKRGSRLVVLPDYQGIGIGYAFTTYIAKYLGERGYVFHAVTSAKNFISKLGKSSDWKLKGWGARNDTDRQRGKHVQPIKDRKLATFVYVGEGSAKPRHKRRTSMTTTKTRRGTMGKRRAKR